MDARPEPIRAPNGVELRSHPVAGGVVRGEASASYLVGDDTGADAPAEVVLEQGTLWVNASGLGPDIEVSAGAVQVTVRSGAVVIEAGYSGEGLILVSAGEVEVSDSTGDVRTLAGGQVGIIDPDGSIAAVDEVGEDELAADPWVVANAGLDAEAAGLPAPVEPAEPEDEPAEPAEDAPGDGEAEDVEAAVVATVLAGLDHDATKPVAAVGDEPTGEDPDHANHELPYAVEPEDGAADGRRFVRTLEIVLLVVVIAVGALVIALYSRKDRQASGPPSIAAPISVVQSTTERPGARTTTTAPSTTTRPTTTTTVATTTTAAATTTGSTAATTTAPVSTATAAIRTCTVKNASTIVVSGTVKGGRAPSTEYRITATVQQKDGGAKLGEATKNFPIPLDGSQVQWQIDVPITGDYAGATCGIQAELV